MTTSPLQILVVEDNQNTLETLCEMLSIIGHLAHGVASAEEAIDILNSRTFDALLADINLPGMSGIQLAEIAVETTPDIKVIFASGFGYLVADKTDFDFVLLPKPYGLMQLKHAVESIAK
jgi:CheY-like chemotaxis protein